MIDGNRMNSEDSGNNIAIRLLDFAVRSIKLVNALPKSPVGKHIGLQFLRSATSPGANYEESRGAESRADFVHKLGIVLKELKESRYWLNLIKHSDIIPPHKIGSLVQECEELCAIIAKSIATAKKNRSIQV